MLMCLSCGEFVRAKKEDGSYVPLPDECPDCSEEKFKNVHTEEVIEVAD
jgi:predicted  nucleic acid-binding Zn-ribbon protein